MHHCLVTPNSRMLILLWTVKSEPGVWRCSVLESQNRIRAWFVILATLSKNFVSHKILIFQLCWMCCDMFGNVAWKPNITKLEIHWEYTRFSNFTYMKGISQDFSDCGLHNDKYTKYLPHKNCVNRACIESLKVL